MNPLAVVRGFFLLGKAFIDFLDDVWYNESMVSVQEIVDWRGGLLDVVDKDGNVVPIDRRQEFTLIDGKTPSSQEKKGKVGGKAVKGFFCGDCLAEIPRGSACAHMKTGKRGGRYASDDTRY